MSTRPINIAAAIIRLHEMAQAMTSLIQTYPLLMVQAVQIHANKSVAWIDPPDEADPLRKSGTLQSRADLGETEIEEIYTLGIGPGVFVNWIDRKRRVKRIQRRYR